VEDVAAILGTQNGVPIDPLLFQRPGIRWGAVAIRKSTSNRVSETGGGYVLTQRQEDIANTGFQEEVEATRWIASSLDDGKSIPLAEAQAVIRSLAVALHQDRDVLQPLFRLGTSADPTTQTVGAAILTMAFAERLGMRDDEVRATGVAALLHDIGLSRVPPEILGKTEMLTAEEEVEYQKHTQYGARMILESDKDLSLAALVAYEHHIAPDGSGYPALAFPREPHKVSKMVAICSTYHSRRSNMPYRPGMEGRAVLNHIEWYAGTKYDSQLSIAFVAMMQDAMQKQPAAVN
jgi:HD-GYP domain-containing protein (c-di-GMP phosphodiesterase class II)